MIRAYDDHGNVVDMVAHDKEIRSDAISECIGELEENYKMASENVNYPEYDAYCCGIEDSINSLDDLKEK